MVRRQKRELRGRIRAELAQISIDELTDASNRIASRLVATELWHRAEMILAFSSMPAEIQTSYFVSAALAEGKRIALPRVTGHELVFSEWTGQDEELVSGVLGIREPRPDAPTLELDTSVGGSQPTVLIVVPGLAFGRDGSRLGRSGGYYDRYLAANRIAGGIPVDVIGICIHRFLFDSVPTEPHDQFVHWVITEKETVACRAL